jgi:hypothetical protein
MAVIGKTLLGQVELLGSAVNTYTFVASAETNTIANSEVRILCDTATNVVDLTLPEISEFAGLYGILRVIVIDKSANATTNNIIVRAGGTDTINDAADVTLALDGSSLMLSVGAEGLWATTNAAIV